METPEGIRIVSSQLRSTNLERDVIDAQLGPIYIGVRAQDMLDRVTAALEDRTRTRAWALTGPYGTGKSTQALLIAALLGRDAARRAEADRRLAAASTTLAERFAAARERCAPNGMIGAIATARRESLFDTLARALRNGAAQAWPTRRTPKSVTAALTDLDAPDAGSEHIIAAVRALCSDSPLLLVIDEFGKSLEHLAARGEFADGQADVFLLQELAEAGAGTRGLPLHLLTLQHLSFGDYASRATNLQSREWAKIQGRFEDITMTTHLGDAVHLIQRTLDHSEVSPEAATLIRNHAESAEQVWTAQGLDGVMAADADLFASVYPLHPLTVAVAPLLAGQIGQHDRSLTGFIASDEPHTVARFLAQHSRKAPSRASTVRLADVFDFFLGAGRTTLLASANASRWIEIDTRISEANGLPEDDQEVLKTIGLLNLVDASGALRASLDTVLFALTDPTDTADPQARQALWERIDGLIDRNFLVHREFSDEYRVWQGSDVDLGAEIQTLIERCDDHTAVNVVNRYLPVAVVAGRHSQSTGMLRHFITSASDAETGTVTGCQIGEPADGMLLFHFGDESTIPTVNSPLPVAVGISGDAKTVLAAARYLHALEELSYNDDYDAVARRELTERIAQANAELATRVAAAFTPNLLAPNWHLMAPNDNGTVQRPRGAEPLAARSLAGVVSAACDAIYPYTPEIRNEMLGRHQLTSQGAKARRELMEAMLTRPTQANLGIDGYGPERAMYGGVLQYLGLHQPVKTTSIVSLDTLVPYAFSAPKPESSLAPAWRALSELLAGSETPVSLDRVLHFFMAPPYGIKAGMAPLVVLATLLVGEQDLAVFEEGTYQPRLTPALIERMVKAPNTFAVKTINAGTGPRKQAINEIANLLDVGAPSSSRPGVRNAALLAVARELLDKVRVLSPYAQRTKNLSREADAVRTALREAREPDVLIFDALPAALGLPAVPVRGKADKQAAQQYAASLATALAEIADIDQRLQRTVITAIATAFRLPDGLSELRAGLAQHTEALLDVSLIEARLRGLITITHEATISDDQWLDMAVVRIAGRGMGDWRDTDAAAFPQQAAAMSKNLDRVGHLYQSEQLQEGTQPYSVRLLTLTGADGREDHARVHIPDALRDKAHELARTVLAEARDNLGAQGERILLAMLAEALISDAPAGTGADDDTQDLTEKKAVS
ncbi:ATP-binding protein [Micromonospora echinospora]|uniref:ATP-binding protein n=1 Tax=Micromonospora echinospora TaxID=1877 RepID=UPI0018D54725|nr:ATP-binding protein [Micromonospora echinospora]